MFDVLTYEKGAGVLWMLEQYLGRERFRAGVRRYLDAHKYGNTETTDLWDAIEVEAGDIPIRALMDSWIFQGGYPLVSAKSALDDGGAEVVQLVQTPFSYLPADAVDGDSAVGSHWLVPLLVPTAGGEREVQRVLLGPSPEHVEVDGTPVVVNTGGSGFYRLRYDRALRSALLADLGALAPLERFNLVADIWATTLAGIGQTADYFELLPRLVSESDPHVWSVVIGALALLHRIAPDADRPALHELVRALLAPHLAKVGWERVAGEDEQTPLLRSTLISALGTIGEDPAVVQRAHELFVAEHAGGARLDPDLAPAILGVVAAHATRVEFDADPRPLPPPPRPDGPDAPSQLAGAPHRPGARLRGARPLPDRDPQPERAVPAFGDARQLGDRTDDLALRELPLRRAGGPFPRQLDPRGCWRGSPGSPSSTSRARPATPRKCARSARSTSSAQGSGSSASTSSGSTSTFASPSGSGPSSARSSPRRVTDGCAEVGTRSRRSGRVSRRRLRPMNPNPRSAVLLERARATPGFMPEDEGLALADVARRATASGLGPLIELGAYRGRSTLFLTAGLVAAVEGGAPRGLCFSLDHHRGSEEMQAGWEHHDPSLTDARTGRMDSLPDWRRNMEDAGVEELVVGLIGDSPAIATVWRTQASLVFVDGGHGTGSAWADYRGWGPHVAAGWLPRLPRRLPGPG